MRDYNNPSLIRDHAGPAIDQGLRTYMIRIYNYMALGLGITSLVSYVAGSSPEFMVSVLTSPLKWLVMLAPVGVVFFLSTSISRLSASAAQLTFWIYAGLMGLSLSTLFVIFTGESVAKLFFITASVFGSMSLYGYTTQRDLSQFASFLMMGLIGLVVASLVNLFTNSSAMQFIISAVGVLVFTGLTASDTQAIKERYYNADNSEVASKKAIFGALMLYLNFINLFISLLQIFGDRR